MCATFSPIEDILASASLDQTVRLWDLTGLRERTVASSARHGGHTGGTSVSVGLSGADVFGATDAVCKFVLEGEASNCELLISLPFRS